MTPASVAAGVVIALGVHVWLRRGRQRWGAYVVPGLFVALLATLAWRGALDDVRAFARALGALVLTTSTWLLWGLEGARDESPQEGTRP